MPVFRYLRYLLGLLLRLQISAPACSLFERIRPARKMSLSKEVQECDVQSEISGGNDAEKLSSFQEVTKDDGDKEIKVLVHSVNPACVEGILYVGAITEDNRAVTLAIGKDNMNGSIRTGMILSCFGRAGPTCEGSNYKWFCVDSVVFRGTKDVIPKELILQTATDIAFTAITGVVIPKTYSNDATPLRVRCFTMSGIEFELWCWRYNQTSMLEKIPCGSVIYVAPAQLKGWKCRGRTSYLMYCHRHTAITISGMIDQTYARC